MHHIVCMCDRVHLKGSRNTHFSYSSVKNGLCKQVVTDNSFYSNEKQVRKDLPRPLKDSSIVWKRQTWCVLKAHSSLSACFQNQSMCCCTHLSTSNPFSQLGVENSVLEILPQLFLLTLKLPGWKNIISSMPKIDD